MSVRDEQIAVYDAAGAVVGAASRARMRREGLWHAATAVLVRSQDGRSVYVHRRTDSKEVYPGMYDCWAGGVVAAGEDPDAAARRELAEELGVTGSAVRWRFRTVHELATVRFHAFVYETRWSGSIVHQPDEVADGGWMPLDELRAKLGDPGFSFVPDGRQFIEEWFSRRLGD
ncbi:NUDIX domain-containing protein [Allosaccharopolyspora coralli]|uniref:NUDIX domain-containing protein n=1 Tax=Allosaccharopolyspora coralli TaxID=2665642 RepID=A0A5Q3Q589_9PSEU|nr:NUDIX domain-containing protein [Allosaccharopolyspora coralli]QGK69791.1 NUDIX domain-containing protein [Allosaccharopolyspora coralli]